MQPYLFPYFGYFQLLFCADVFVLYDDANYIKQGYINRNTIMAGGRPYRFTVPVSNGSSNSRIKDVTFLPGNRKLLRTIEQGYAGARCFDVVFPMLERVLSEGEHNSVTDVCEAGIRLVSDYLDVPVRLVRASAMDYDRSGDASAKLASMCRAAGADEYVNSIGGQHLYNGSWFESQGIRLRFLKPSVLVYDQPAKEFIPNLSIIDVLMRCERQRILDAIPECELVDPA